MTILTIIIFVVILSVVVIIHEIGHFAVARFFGVTVKEFGIGLPPKAMNLFRAWGTQFTLNWLPLGGFVNLEGEDENLSEGNLSEAAFFRQKPWKRGLIFFAGPAMNVILAVGIFVAVFSVLGLPEKFSESVFIDYIEKDSPAAAAGIPERVRILTLHNENGDGLNVTDVDQAVEFIGQHKGQQLTITTTGECTQGTCQEISRTFQAHVRTDEEKPAGTGALGVALTQYQDVFYPWYQQIPLSVYHGTKQSLLLAKDMVVGLGQAVMGIFGGEKNEVVMMGPVGIVSQLDKQKTFSEGFWAILQFAGLLSLNLGIVNLLPIPALDGGRLLLIGVEKIIGRAKIAKVELQLNYFGFLLVMGLAVLVTGADIWRILKGG